MLKKRKGKWYESAEQLLRSNNINANVFPAALQNLLRNGRENDRNIIYGPGNSEKTSAPNLILLF